MPAPANSAGVHALRAIGADVARLSSAPATAAVDATTLRPLVNGALNALLRAVAEDGEALSHVARRSYHHPNGFDKIVLCATTKSEPELRLHIWWPAGGGRAGEHVHNHPWYFRSAVLAGELETSFYAVANAGARYVRYRFDPPERRGADGYSIHRVGEAFLETVFDGRVAAGTVYGLAPSVLHKARGAPGVMTATLVLQGAFVKEPSDVYVTSPLPPGGDGSVRHFSADDVRRKLERYLELCSS